MHARQSFDRARAALDAFMQSANADDDDASDSAHDAYVDAMETCMETIGDAPSADDIKALAKIITTRWDAEGRDAIESGVEKGIAIGIIRWLAERCERS